MKYINNYKIFESNLNKQYLYDIIEDVIDFPKKGIIFKDMSFLLSDNKAVNMVVNEICNNIKDRNIDIVLGLDARGFILGPMIANKLGIGFGMARKKGKAPEHYKYRKYDLEYGSDEMGISPKIIKPGMNVHIHDDLLATGGSVTNIMSLIQEMDANVDSLSFIMELEFLNGRNKIENTFDMSDVKIYSVLQY